MKILLCFSFFLFTFAFCLNCGNDTVTNNPTNPGTQNSITLLYPSNDTVIPWLTNDSATFSWSFTGTPTKFIWQSDTCKTTEPTFNSPLLTNYPVYNPQNHNPVDTTIDPPNYYFRIAWRVKAIFGNDTITTPYRYMRKF